MKNNKDIGIYRKYRVSRTDGSSRKGKKHEHCKYFVLDLYHDKFARAAMKTYSEICYDEFPILSNSIKKWLDSGVIDF